MDVRAIPAHNGWPPQAITHTAPGITPFATIVITDTSGSKITLEFTQPTDMHSLAIAASLGAQDLANAQAQPPLTEEDVPL
jgi:hypothetical protein